MTMLFVFGMAVPTWDQYSDYYLTARLLSDAEERTRRFGFIMLSVISVMTFFAIRQWWTLEKSRKDRLLTFPFVLFQIYPQYIAGRILYLGFKQKKSWRKEQKSYETDLMSLGKYY